MNAIPLGWENLALSLAMMAAVIVVDRVMRLMLGKDLVIGTIRVFIQLYLVGYILKWVFEVDSPWIVCAVLALMSFIAGYNAVKRVGDTSIKSAVTATGIIVFSTLISAGLGCWFIIGIEYWYDPQYLIPIGGMAMNGAMNGVALGLANLRTSVRDNSQKIECALSMGATSKQAIHPLLTEAARRSLIPTVNGLMTAGIVQLPGMMTGQIIAGLDPTSAVRYQIVIYYFLAVATTSSVLLAMKIASDSYFTKAQQLKPTWRS